MTEYGYTAGGYGTGYSSVTEKYDDVADTWAIKADLNTARFYLAGFSLNHYGYTAGGGTGGNLATTEKYDDVANIWIIKANLNTARWSLSGFQLNGFGYTAGGFGRGANISTEKYDDVANTWTAKANLNMARQDLSGFSQNGYGYTAGGYGIGYSSTTEKYDDVADTWITKANLNTARERLTGFSLNNFGYTAGGESNAGISAVTEKYDDSTNIWTVKANLNTARSKLSGISLNGYGYTSGGVGGLTVAEKYDNITNTWTTVKNLNVGRQGLAGFEFSARDDIIPPVINSIHLSSTTPIEGTNITVTVDVTDNVAMSTVTANNIILTNTIPPNIWVGYIIAEAGTHVVTVIATDSSGNITIDTSQSYTALSPVAVITATNIDTNMSQCLEPCTIIVTVAWINNGNAIGMFEPAIIINDTRTGSGTNISLDIGSTYTGIFTISDLMKGTYTICPDPN